MPDEAPEDAPERGPGVGRRFLTVWVGQTLSSVGSTVSGVGVGVWAFLQTGSTAWLGVLVALAAAPTVLLAPLMRIIDRVPRRRVMIAGDVVAGVAALGVLALAWAGRLELWHLAVSGFVGGAGTAFQVPAFQAAIPSLVEPAAIDRANGLSQLGPALGITAGPLLAAPIVGWWGIEAVLAIDAITFAIAVATVLAIPFGEAPDTTRSATVVEGHRPEVDEPVVVTDDGSWRAAGLWLWGAGRALLALLVTMSVVNFVLAAFNLAFLALSVEVGGTDLAGVPLAAGGIAMIAGSVMVGARGLPARRIRFFACALVGLAVGFGVAGSRPSVWVLTAGIAIALPAVPAVGAATSTIFHEHVPGGMQGRVFALRGAISQGLGPVGSLIAGFATASIASPAMEPDAWGGRTIGRLIGTGSDRGPALVIVAVGMALVAIALHLATSRTVATLDRSRSSPPRS